MSRNMLLRFPFACTRGAALSQSSLARRLLINANNGRFTARLFTSKVPSNQLPRSATRLTTAKPYQLEPGQGRLILVVFTLSSLILGYDLYYYLYQYEKPIDYLVPDKFIKAGCSKIMEYNHDTSLYRFDVINQALGSIPCPAHVLVKDDSCQIARSYTPISWNKHHIDILVKKYDQGAVSSFIHSLGLGGKVSISGPILSFPYERNMAKDIGMIAGGTGITPFYQMIKKIIREDPLEKTRISLIYASKTPSDLLLKPELEILAAQHPDRLRVSYVVEDKQGSNEDFAVGYITSKVLKQHLPPSRDGSLVLVCGPDGMINHIAGPKLAQNNQGELSGLLKELGYNQQQVFKF